jgi:hypothetical protein
MRTLFLVTTVTFACALMGWLVYSQPTSAGNDRAPSIAKASSQPSQPDFNKYSPIAEEERDQAMLAQCDQKAAKQLGHDDKMAFILQCLQAADGAQQR